ncbi:MAG: protein kinase, partial [Myxococcota bacterium]|nr:protein kinase [Myxococcota bacterium]
MSQEDDLKGQLQRTLTAPLGGEDTAQLSNRTLTGGEIEGWVPGTHLGGQYRLIDLLGDGGMGAVYLARDVLLGRRVAIKSLRPPDSIAHDPRARAEYIQMFQRDATSTARLNHPNIVTIHNTGVHEGIPFMVLEYLEGESLDEILERGALGEEEATRVAGTLARALAYAHERGVIHRDIKPANIFITKQGQVKLLDFGVALLQMSKIVAAEDADITAEELRARIGQGSTVAGTPAYMAPEQLIGDMQDHRVDIWALGVVLFEMITGARPSLSTNHTVHGRLDFTPLEPFHEETQQIVRACLQRSAQLRVGTAASLARRLEQATMRLTAPNPSVQLPHNKTLLPEVHGEFLGRDVELEELLEHFAHPTTPLLTVTGAPGVGKSRLALEIAHRASSIFTLTAHLDLHDCESLLAVPAALARTFGYTSMEQDRGIFQQLDLLLETTERVLFVLDGLREDASWGSELLEFFIEHERKPELLVTSRRPLRIRGEAVYLLTPLQLPTHEDDGDALRLYYAMLPATTAHLLDSKSERESARALVRHLDGLPIAIELAAKRAEMLPPAAMLDRIDRPFDLLRPPASAHDARALEEIFEDAWERLSHAEKVALASASLFHGSFSLEAAEVVIGELDQLDPAPFVLDLCEELARLVRRGGLCDQLAP